MKKYWWKILGALIILYSIIAGLLLPVPRLYILNETIRNLYYHVPMWFAMIIMMLVSFISSILYLAKQKKRIDIRATEYTYTGMLLGLLGILTGMIWAQFTWGYFWTNDPKLNGVAISMLIYSGYYILRQAIEDEEKRARVSAVFNIFAFPIFIVLIGIMPRVMDSVHPGNGGNPGFGTYDLDNNMKMVFYPVVFGWMLMGTWIATLRIRIKKLELHEELEDE